jgi:hypothetical protein
MPPTTPPPTRPRPQAAQVLGQQRRQHVQAAVGQVDGGAARRGLAVQLAALRGQERCRQGTAGWLAGINEQRVRTCPDLRAPGQRASCLKCRRSPTWRTKYDTSAMCTPTSTRRRPPPPSASQRTDSASSTSVQPGGSMLRGGGTVGEGGGNSGRRSECVPKRGLHMRQEPRCVGGAGAGRGQSWPVPPPHTQKIPPPHPPADQVLWPPQVAPGLHLLPRHHVVGAAGHRGQLAQRALAERGGGGRAVEHMRVLGLQCAPPAVTSAGAAQGPAAHQAGAARRRALAGGGRPPT